MLSLVLFSIFPLFSDSLQQTTKSLEFKLGKLEDSQAKVEEELYVYRVCVVRESKCVCVCVCVCEGGRGG